MKEMDVIVISFDVGAWVVVSDGTSDWTKGYLRTQTCVL